MINSAPRILVFLPETGSIIEDRSNSLGATRDTDKKKSHLHKINSFIASLRI